MILFSERELTSP